MFLEILAGLACLFASFLQYCVHRSPDVVDSPVTQAARRITMVSLFVAGLYIIYRVVYFDGASTPFVLSSGLFGLGQLLFALNNLFDDLEVSGWNSHLHNSK